MPALNNIRHESFVRAYLKCGVGADAYQQAYPRAARSTAGRNSWILLNRHAKVRNRLTELRTEVLKKSDITLDRVLTDLEHAFNLAEAQERPADMIKAAMAQAKLAGLLKDHVEQTHVLDSAQSPEEILAIVAAEYGPEVSQALANAFGMDWDKSSD